MFWQLGCPLRQRRKDSVSPQPLGLPGHGVVVERLCLSTQESFFSPELKWGRGHR